MTKLNSLLIIAALTLTQAATGGTLTDTPIASSNIKLALHHGGLSHRSRTHREVRHSHYYDPRHYHWTRVSDGVMPVGAVLISSYGSSHIFHCRARYKGHRYIGTVKSGEPCVIKVNGKSMSVKRYHVMTH